MDTTGKKNPKDSRASRADLKEEWEARAVTVDYCGYKTQDHD